MISQFLSSQVTSCASFKLGSNPFNYSELTEMFSLLVFFSAIVVFFMIFFFWPPHFLLFVFVLDARLQIVTAAFPSLFFIQLIEKGCARILRNLWLAWRCLSACRICEQCADVLRKGLGYWISTHGLDLRQFILQYLVVCRTHWFMHSLWVTWIRVVLVMLNGRVICQYFTGMYLLLSSWRAEEPNSYRTYTPMKM